MHGAEDGAVRAVCKFISQIWILERGNPGTILEHMYGASGARNGPFVLGLCGCRCRVPNECVQRHPKDDEPNTRCFSKESANKSSEHLSQWYTADAYARERQRVHDSSESG